MNQRILLAFVLTFLVFNAQSAYLKKVPIQLTQPNGQVITCFVTGDEYHRRIHDGADYTIIQDPSNGYYVYATLYQGKLIPSPYVVGSSDPKSLQLKPGWDQFDDDLEQEKPIRLKSTRLNSTNSTKGIFNNIVISIRFSDQAPSTLPISIYENGFNNSTSLSLSSYYKEVSNGQLNISTKFFPVPVGNNVTEYVDSQPRGYYSMFDEYSNPNGYKGGEWYDREHTLLKNAIQFVSAQILSSGVNFDSNNDGFIDNIIFVFQGFPDSWGDLLWPMTSSLSGDNIFIGSKKVNSYNKQLSGWLNADVICHEFFHSLGAPDLYRYIDKTIDPVGFWDIMGITGAQHMTTFMKWKYGKWFDTIPEIKEPGKYTLAPVSQSPFSCYKLVSPTNPDEYFILEYRKKEGILESTLPTDYEEGLIIYRINTKVNGGNAIGPPDEVYVYRPYGDSNQNGWLNKASFSLNSSRTLFNGETSPSCFLSNGTSGEIEISDISSTDNTISFNVNPVNILPKPQNFMAELTNGNVFFKWNSPKKSSLSLLGYNLFLSNGEAPLNSSIINDSTFMVQVPGGELIYEFNLTAVYQQGESERTSCILYNTTDPAALDSLALVAIYNKCDGPNWTYHDNWLNGPLVSWYGVTVQNRRVIELKLFNKIEKWEEPFGMKGSLPDEMQYLTELRELELYQNYLTGTLPKGLIKCKKLKRINISKSNLSGSFPPVLANLDSLETIMLDGNKLNGTFPQEIIRLSNLKDFLLSENNIEGSLPENIGNLEKLERLILFGNQLTGEIPTSIGNCSKLEQLILGRNKLTGNIPDEIYSLTNLKGLNLGENSLEGNISSKVGNLQLLEDLNLSFNKLSGKIPDEIWDLKNLTGLSLTNYFGKLEGSISQKIGQLKTLRVLGLADNQLSGTIPEEIGQLSELRILDLSFNKFTGFLPKTLGSLRNLEMLTLNYNQLSGSIPKTINAFSKLTSVKFGNNQFENLSDLSSLTNLTMLDAINNKFTFEDLEPNQQIVFQPGCFGFLYYGQAKIGIQDTVLVPTGYPYTLSIYCGGSNNLYQWYKDGLPVSEIQVSPDFVVSSIASGFNGQFTCKVTNTLVPSLIIESYPITILGNNSLIANAGLDIGVDEATIVTLDGSASYNPGGGLLSYRWTAPEGITLSNSSVVNPTFTAPPVEYDTPFIFYLTVDDGTKDSPVDEVVITVKNTIEQNHSPLADAGADQIVNEGDLVTLDGSGSLDMDGDKLNFSWIAPDIIDLSEYYSKLSSFIAPEVSQDTNMIFVLNVNDGNGGNTIDTVIITILNNNHTPVFTQFPLDIIMQIDETFNFTFSAHDPENNRITYSVVNNVGSIDSINGSYTFASTEEGIYSPIIRAYDGILSTDYTFTISVKNQIASNCLVNASYDEIPDTGTSGQWLGQSFTCLNSGTLEKIKLTIWPDAETYLVLRKWVSDTYDNAFDGEIISTSSKASEMPSVDNWIEMSTFYFPSQPELTKGTKYLIEVLAGTPYVKIPGTYSGGMAYETANPTFERDMRFAVHVCSESTTEAEINEEQENIQIYPNPTSGNINIEGIKGQTTISVFNSYGQKIIQHEETKVNSEVINLSGFSDGIYILVITTYYGSTVHKIVLNKLE